MSETRLFVYGTLMNDEVMSELIGRIVESSTATLAEFKCLSVSGQSYPGIRPSKGSRVDGLLLHGLSRAEMKILDNYEGDQYQLESVSVDVRVDRPVKCLTYVFKPEFYHQLSDESWCNHAFRKNHLIAFTADL